MALLDHPEILFDALSAIAPDAAEVFVAQIEEDAAFEYPEEAALREEAGSARQQEFIAGRKCARGALAELGQPEGPILSDEKGAPVWPVGFVGSISHSKGLCCAITGEVGRFETLGLDLERTNRLSLAAQKYLMHPREIHFGFEDQVRATILFSLKEAFFKAQFPIHETQPAFREVCFEVDTEEKTARIVAIAERLPEGVRTTALNMRFSYALLDEYVVCVAWNIA